MTRFQEYKQWLLATNKYVLDVHDMGDGRCAYVEQLLFTTAIKTSEIGDRECSLDRWCYTNRILALAALLEWRKRDWDGEPYGWVRHPASGRRRKNGDAQQEYVRA